MGFTPLDRGKSRLFDYNLNRMLQELYEMSQSQFGEVKTAARTPIIELLSSNGVSAIRDVETVTGSGAISNSSTGEIQLSTGATASSSARLDSAERVRYMPGMGCEFGVAVRIPTLPTGSQEIKWGLRTPDESEGIYFGVDATGFYTATLRNSVQTKVRQADFNIDKYDGTGESRNTLDLAAGNIFQTDFTLYFYGQFLYQIVGVINAKQKPIDLHWVKPDGATSVRTPNMPVFVEATNGGDAADIEVFVGGRAASIVGLYRPKFRTVSEMRSGVSTTTTAVPLVSFRNKTGFEDRSIRLSAATAAVASEDHVIELYLEPTLTGASWGTPTNHTASETAMETDVSATALSGGTLIYSFYATAGQANRDEETDNVINVNVPENQILTMAARTVTGTGTAMGFLRLREEW